MNRAEFLRLCGAAPLALSADPGTAAQHGAGPADPALPPAAPPDRVPAAVAPRARPFDLAQVRLLDGPFRDAMLRDRAYLLRLEPDRLLHGFRAEAGLPPKAPIYGGWESAGIAGHVPGHYLSACAMLYRATGDAEIKRRVDYMVGELALCQRANGNGYVSAIPGGKKIFAQIAAGSGGAIAQGWVPWYTIHKLFAGLRDAHLLCGSAPARDVLVGLAGWTWDTTHGLSDAEFQKMLDTEQGGMDEVLADVYALTGETKYLDLARRFCHRRILDPMARDQDMLNGFHANTQIPKVIGFARLYALTGEKPYGEAARFFWRTVVDNRSYVIGGNSDYEHFFDPADYDHHLSSATCETCNSYNMLKLTRSLFALEPSAERMDYYERTLYNHILASQDPDSGMMTYFVSLRPGYYKLYSDPLDSFWCCVGTGIENHVKYGDTIYSHDDRSLWVNLFIASELRWAEKGVTVRQETRFPEADTTRLTLTCAKPTKLALKVRYPGWAEGMTVAVNGRPVAVSGKPASYVTVERTWKSGDVVEVRLPMRLRLEPLPRSATYAALLYGPVVLAGDLGWDGMAGVSDIVRNQDRYPPLPPLEVPALVAERETVLGRVRPVPGKPLTFRTDGLGRPGDVTLAPFYRTHHRRYSVYWAVYSPGEWGRRQAELAAEAGRQRELDARTVDTFRPGEQQPEADHHLLSERSNAGDFGGRHWRDAREGGWFSFEMRVLPDAPVDLVCTYWGGDVGGRVFDVLADGVVVATQTLENAKPGAFVDRTYPLPPELTRGKTSVTVRLQAKPGRIAGGLFGCRTVRRAADAAPAGAA